MAFDWKKIKSFLGKTEDLTADEERELEKLMNPANPTPTPPAKVEPSDNSTLQELQNLVKALTAQNQELMSALGAEKESRSASARAIEEQAKAEKAKKVDAKIEELVKAAIIAPSDEKEKEYWKQLLEANYDATAVIADKQIGANKESASSSQQQGSSVNTQTAPEDKMAASRRNALSQIASKLK